MTKSLRNCLSFGTALASFCLAANLAMAAVTPQEADRLKTTLTPLGGERAGNKSGEIPAWTGGFTQVPPGYRSGEPRPDFFKGDAKVMSITAANVAKYKDRLPAGAVEMFTRFPDSFRIDVYPTHRSAAAPQYVYDNTFKNATRANLTEDGNSLTGAYGGLPFPVPKNGTELMWNHALHWNGFALKSTGGAAVIDSSGQMTIVMQGNTAIEFPYYDPQGSVQTVAENKTISWMRATTTYPPEMVGGANMSQLTIDPINMGTPGWMYLPGQRRVRRSPYLAYDTPNFMLSGVGQLDEFGVFFGALDRYTWKLVGKKEMYVPYNDNKAWLQSASALVGPHHLNPDVVRWELHRVWVVDATLAPGKRNAVPHRVLYLDEDTSTALMADEYDASEHLWRFLYALPITMPELPCELPFTVAEHDFQTRQYAVQALVTNANPIQVEMVSKYPDGFFSPASLAGSGSR